MKKFLVLLLALLTLSGCSKDTNTYINTRGFEIMLDDNKYVTLEIPSSWNLTEQDAYSYWKFNENITVYKSTTKVVSGKEEGNILYTNNTVSRNFDEASISFHIDKVDLDFTKNMLANAKVLERDVLQYRELEIESLPEYTKQPMLMTENELYMPEGYSDVMSEQYTAAHKVDGNSFILSWIARDKIEDYKPILHNIVTCNSSSKKLDSWYESDDIYYAVCEDKVVAAKKITYNRWVCYCASNDSYADYVIQAMFNIEAK